jgi:hypothetical protein
VGDTLPEQLVDSTQRSELDFNSEVLQISGLTTEAVRQVSFRVVRCVYFFAGIKRKGDIRAHLESLCIKHGMAL